MKVSVIGLWHLGSVTAACLASARYSVTAYDEDSEKIQNFNSGKPPLFEPGLEEMIRKGVEDGHLTFTSDPSHVKGSEIVWITYDTPVDQNDHADIEWVYQRIESLFPYFSNGALVIISSQLPAGSTRKLQKKFDANFADRSVGFAYSPENLRLGKAIEVFTRPDRIVIGLRNDLRTAKTSENVKDRIKSFLQPFTNNIEWMSVESAEMTKHALNAFLATSVTFINELATLCEGVGADATEVERGLKSEVRIGPKAYLKPGSAFAGGTLARDVSFLVEMGRQQKFSTPLFKSVLVSNEQHKAWYKRRIDELLVEIKEKRIAILGLTYKPGTSTLRRSTAVELCRWLYENGAEVRAFDPAVELLDKHLREQIQLAQTLDEVLSDADVAVVCTEWPEFRKFNAQSFVSKMRRPLVLDPSRFLNQTLGCDSRIQYISVGKGIVA